MRRLTGRLQLGLLVVGLALLARGAPAAEVEWRAPSSCPDAAELRFRIERTIGMPLGQAAPLRFEVTATRAEQGFAAHVAAHPGEGEAGRERTLAAPDCSGLADLVAVTLALALGADAGEGQRGGATLAPVDQGTAPAPASSVETAPPGAAHVATSTEIAAPGADATPEAKARVEVASGGWHPGVSLWLVGDSGSLPKPGLGAELGAQIGSSSVELRLSGTWLFRQHQLLAGPTEPRPGADLGLVLGALSGCGALWGSFEGPRAAYACGGWELGQLSGTGTNVQRPRNGGALWSAPRLDVGARWALGGGGLELAALLSLAVPLVRKDFVLGELGVLHRPPAAVARAGIGINWSWR